MKYFDRLRRVAFTKQQVEVVKLGIVVMKADDVPLATVHVGHGRLPDVVTDETSGSGDVRGVSERGYGVGGATETRVASATGLRHAGLGPTQRRVSEDVGKEAKDVIAPMIVAIVDELELARSLTLLAIQDRTVELVEGDTRGSECWQRTRHSMSLGENEHTGWRFN